MLRFIGIFWIVTGVFIAGEGSAADQSITIGTGTVTTADRMWCRSDDQQVMAGADAERQRARSSFQVTRPATAEPRIYRTTPRAAVPSANCQYTFPLFLELDYAGDTGKAGRFPHRKFHDNNRRYQQQKDRDRRRSP